MRVGYFSFEGGEGAGKSEQVKLLHQRYPEMVVTREPGGTELGAMIRATLYDGSRKWNENEQLVLFTADRLVTNDEVIFPALTSGRSVLSDRSFMSLVYQCSSEFLGGLDRDMASEYVSQLELTRVRKPDITFLLNIDPEEGLRRRMSAGNVNVFDEMKLEQHRLINRAFLELPEVFPFLRFVIIDASRPADEIFRQIATEIDAFLAS